ncbi:hypothetical protein DFH08DRAFT_770205 [Mycena albidolilacea]|uniref:Uncharacterized protein n=1 Tax=Mycena albidolilacea TaxID=1033008 RepID=A0AAD7AGU0_9AGAR|nr:hypothetical protein DFH08DRAFT_770205 [Mycena albidolilacea]
MICRRVLVLHLPRFHSWPARLRLSGIVVLSLLCLLNLRHELSLPWAGFPSTTLDPLAQQLGHPTFAAIRGYEQNLPQHIPPDLLSKRMIRPRYLFFPAASWGLGWNNVFQEQLLNTHLAYLSERAYVFPDYTPWDHPPFPDTLENGTRHMLHIPMNAFVSGPTGGGPLSSDGKNDSLMRRAVSEQWWDMVCPQRDVVVVKLHDTMRQMKLDGMSEGADILTNWTDKLLKMSAPCVSIEGGSVFDYMLFGSERMLSVWPSYGDSPTLKHFAWSPMITAALFRNFHLLSPHDPPRFLSPTGVLPYNFQSFLPYHSSEAPIAGLLGIHVRRGDYEGHCVLLADSGAEYNAWNRLGTPNITSQIFTPPGYLWPALPDYLDVPEGKSRRDAAMKHCWPSPDAIVARAHAVREARRAGLSPPRQDLRKIYISTNGNPAWVGSLAALLQADGWDFASSLDMELSFEERAVAQAVDMSVLAAAESFIGVGFSSLTSNVVQIRLAAGRDPHTIHFW